MMVEIPHIVIVGGGAGGLELATRLGNSLGRQAKAKITLVDRNLTHIWKPLLHEIAAGTLYPQDVEISYLAHAASHHFNFQLGALKTMNRELRHIELASVIDALGQEVIAARSLPYDFLVIAIGSISNDFGVEGVKENCFFLDNAKEAEMFHQEFLYRWLALHDSNPQTRKPLDIVIVGGGATGVELAAELRGMIERLIKYNGRAQGCMVNISILESGPRLVNTLTETLSEKVAVILKNMSINVYLNEVVVRVEKKGVFTRNGLFLKADMMVWSAGIKGPEIVATLTDLEKTPQNRLLVKPSLQTTKDERIFAFGDCAACPQNHAKYFAPPRAQVAHQQASWLAKALPKFLHGEALSEFKFQDYGSLVSISHKAVGNIMRILERSWMIEGKLAKWIYISLYQSHLVTLNGIWHTFWKSIVNLMGRRVKPKLKLH